MLTVPPGSVFLNVPQDHMEVIKIGHAFQIVLPMFLATNLISQILALSSVLTHISLMFPPELVSLIVEMACMVTQLPGYVMTAILTAQLVSHLPHVCLVLPTFTFLLELVLVLVPLALLLMTHQ